jgi:hypothetical protein
LIPETWLEIALNSLLSRCISVIERFKYQLGLTNGGAAKLLRTNTSNYEHDDSYLLR